MIKPWYQLTFEETALQLEINIHKGLSSSEAKSRLLKHGINQLQGKNTTPLWVIFFSQFKDLMIIVLIAAALISGLVGEVKDSIMILVIVFLNAMLGTTQQYRAEKAISALKKMTTPKASVLRDGEIIKVESHDLIPGDIILLEAGSYIPADIRLISAPNFKVNESALTGESVPVEKTSAPLQKDNLPVADRSNMAFSGTVATYGRAKGIVVETGMATQVGKIAELIESVEEKEIPIQKRFHEIGKWLAGTSLAICVFIFFVGLLRGEKTIDMFLTSISLAVAAIPEGLPAVITISLALGARRMAKKKAIIRKLPAVEGLGSVTVICSDKTGTLTQNQMTVTSIIPLLVDERHFLLTAASLCNDATTTIGDPTEKALVIQAQEEGMIKTDMENAYPRLAELPFDSDRKMMTTLHRKSQDEFYTFSKGALEIILDKTTLSHSEKEKVLNKNMELTSAGQRTLGIAYRKFNHHPAILEEKDLVFLGFIAMTDPPRPEAFEAVQLCKTAHIRPIMITGDHKLTALAIARELGIAEEDGIVITGEELEQMSFLDLKEKVKTVNVFARVSPEHKIRIVEALKENGEIVAMTGDGVNDAPALKESDIGVAMGLSGTDVARESADMILTDDNFATIV
ncbi:MAG: HAD-IC family P-type ATPase, partial [Candidatus Margulisiibacteriota bacterium]